MPGKETEEKCKNNNCDTRNTERENDVSSVGCGTIASVDTRSNMLRYKENGWYSEGFLSVSCKLFAAVFLTVSIAEAAFDNMSDVFDCHSCLNRCYVDASRWVLAQIQRMG
ncbi:hypothetical protein TNCV_5084491 [Trichonephila clavipes]|uniref:Uncharacterized protein n=1 Tax=Trichonephila clavipes TaxID=2585209 RepID=A0A8X6S4E6_TRICX|nr:hypothetical protein TNCV_5084491 [Trichonephila clavipes]